MPGARIRAVRDHVLMTRIDERGPPPLVDEAARRRLAAAMERDGVVAAMLFGSQATGQPGPLSDVDIAVWADPGLSRKGRFDLRLELIGRATAALRTEEVDLVVLNDASPLLRHRALRDSVRLVDRDPRCRIRLETRAILDYLDTKPLRELLGAAALNRLAEGRFGRP